MVRIILEIQKNLLLCFWVFSHQTELYSDWGFQSESVPSDRNPAPSLPAAPSPERNWVEPRMVQQRGRWDLQLGKQSLHCSPTASGLQPGKGASFRTQPTSTWRLLLYLHRCLPSPGKLGLCKHAWPLASIRWMLTSASCQGEKLRPRVRKEDFQPEQTNAGSRKGQQVFKLPTGLSGYQAAFVLSDLLLTRTKPLGFSLQEIETAFPSTTPSWSWSSQTVCSGGWASDP